MNASLKKTLWILIALAAGIAVSQFFGAGSSST